VINVKSVKIETMEPITITYAEIVVKDKDGNVLFVARALKEVTSGITMMSMDEFAPKKEEEKEEELHVVPFYKIEYYYF